MQTPPSAKITPRTWFVIIALSLTGQLAWAVENSWFNTFVFDTITPDPKPVAWMVAASAVTATLTTLFMGTLSDRTRTRFGRRKPYILFGYILWGLSTILFPMVSYIKVSQVAVIMVIVADSIMTFFGSTANDAAFNAWTADIATRENRGKVEGAINFSLFVAQIIALVAAGVLIEEYGYFVFFYALGAIVMLVGWLAGALLQEPPITEPAEAHPPFWSEFAELFRLDTLRHNRNLFILMIFIMVGSIGMNVSFPYMIVYLENYVGFSKAEFSVVGGAVMLGSAVLAIPFGIMADKWNKKLMLAVATVVSSLGGVLLSLFNTLGLVAFAGFLWQAFALAVSVASVAWLKDLLPEDKRGKFLGVRMIFWIAIPMVVGPAIGSALITAYGIPTVINNQAGFVPVPIIFQVGSLIALLSLIPLFFMKNNPVPAHE